MSQFTLTETQRRNFAAAYLLEYMDVQGKTFDLLLPREEADLEPILEHLLVHECVEIKDNTHYAISGRGRQTLKRFLDRYREFLAIFDVFSAVDLGAGEFAFASYFALDHQGAWQAYFADERWEDLRVAVAAEKGIHPAEIVFLSFLQEGRFGRDATGWQFDLLLGTVWDEILEICNTALTTNQLGYSDAEGTVPGSAVLHDIVVQGTGLMLDLLDEERRFGGPVPLAGPVAHQNNGQSLRDPTPTLAKLAEDPAYTTPEWKIAWQL